jgi:hypothetical protein
VRASSRLRSPATRRGASGGTASGATERRCHSLCWRHRRLLCAALTVVKRRNLTRSCVGAAHGSFLAMPPSMCSCAAFCTEAFACLTPRPRIVRCVAARPRATSQSRHLHALLQTPCCCCEAPACVALPSLRAASSNP